MKMKMARGIAGDIVKKHILKKILTEIAPMI